MLFLDQLRLRCVELGLQGLHGYFQQLQFVVLSRRRCKHPVFAATDDGFIDIGEEGSHRIEVLHRDGIEFVVVALTATDRQPQPCRADSADAIAQVTSFVILGLGSALFGGQQQAIKARGNLLFLCRIGQQIPGDLFDSELIEWFLWLNALMT